MKLYIIVHSNDKTKPGGWNSSYMGGVEIVQAFTSLEDVRKFLDLGNTKHGHASAMRHAWHAVEIDLANSNPFQL